MISNSINVTPNKESKMYVVKRDGTKENVKLTLNKTIYK